MCIALWHACALASQTMSITKLMKSLWQPKQWQHPSNVFVHKFGHSIKYGITHGKSAAGARAILYCPSHALGNMNVRLVLVSFMKYNSWSTHAGFKCSSSIWHHIVTCLHVLVSHHNTERSNYFNSYTMFYKSLLIHLLYNYCYHTDVVCTTVYSCKGLHSSWS